MNTVDACPARAVNAGDIAGSKLVNVVVGPPVTIAPGKDNRRGNGLETGHPAHAPAPWHASRNASRQEVVPAMLTAAILLAIIGALGAFDILYFHRHHAGLTQRPESRTEAWIHAGRGVIYTLQFAIVANLQLHGAFYVVFVLVYLADIAIGMADIWVEPASRKGLGGLYRGEYLMHIVLSVFVGAYLYALVTHTHGWAALPTALVHTPDALPWTLRVLLNAMAIACLLGTLAETAELVDAGLPRPKALHVAARLRIDVAKLWEITQDPLRHPEWDHRFSRIEMHGDRIEAGTPMTYEKRVLGMTIRGFGRYDLHRPHRQSTFAFWSDDPRSLIRRGVGLWRYAPMGDGTVLFSTSYTYDVRFGLLGRWIDRLLFRPLFCRLTEASFRRLAREHAGDSEAPVESGLGRAGALARIAMSRQILCPDHTSDSRQPVVAV